MSTIAFVGATRRKSFGLIELSAAQESGCLLRTFRIEPALILIAPCTEPKGRAAHGPHYKYDVLGFGIAEQLATRYSSSKWEKKVEDTLSIRVRPRMAGKGGHARGLALLPALAMRHRNSLPSLEAILPSALLLILQLIVQNSKEFAQIAK